MKRLGAVAVSLLAAWSASAADAVVGDARRGEQLFQSEQCIQCHSIHGSGGKVGPDLSRPVGRDYTPAIMASLMWNHAPAMWTAIEKQGIAKPTLSAEGAADLFAYFLSTKFFEMPGDAARGKQIFASKHCADCHGVTESKSAGAPPIAKWESLADPVALAAQMWNHGAKMREAFAQRKLSRPQLSPQELTDVLVYLQNLPETRNMRSTLRINTSADGAALFQAKGCTECHKDSLALEKLLRNQTLTGIATDMWNHQPSMKQPPPQLSEEEMRQIIGYLWAKQYFSGNGDANRGKKVFTDKHCVTCHNDPSSGAPPLAKGKDAYSEITIVSALWQHGPRMLESMTTRQIAWPRFQAKEMSDLIAYLNSL